MKVLTVALLSVIALGLVFSFAVAAGDAAKGKALFHDPKLGGGTTGKSCNSCHPGGKGLEKAGSKKEFNFMGMKQNSLEEVVNLCIIEPLKGKAIDPKGADMANIVAYIKSLSEKPEAPKKAPGY
ncbi:MAG: hypothetical protein AAB089_00960 [Nitrospirota bacterium]